MTQERPIEISVRLLSYTQTNWLFLTFNQWVAGSSPARLTTFPKQKLVLRLVAKPAAFLLSYTVIGFWDLSQGGWIALLAASRCPEAAFAIALSGGGLSPAEQELLDSEYELSKAGDTANEVNDALAFQKLEERDHCFTFFRRQSGNEYPKLEPLPKTKNGFATGA